VEQDPALGQLAAVLEAMKLKKYEHVVTAWAETPSGPGWSNRLVWVLIKDAAKGSFRTECFQPNEQTSGMLEAFDYALLAGSRLTLAVKEACSK
jgi:hypothetical protein